MSNLAVKKKKQSTNPFDSKNGRSSSSSTGQGFIGFNAFLDTSPPPVPSSHSNSNGNSNSNIRDGYPPKEAATALATPSVTFYEGDDAELKLILRHLSKKDAITNVKALKELQALLSQRSPIDLRLAVNHFVYIFRTKLWLKNDKKVRVLAFQVLTTWIVKMRKVFQVHVSTLLPFMWFSQSDPSCAEVRRTATHTFKTVLETYALTKQKALSVRYGREILSKVQEFLAITPSELSETVEGSSLEDIEETYHRSVASALLGLSTFLKERMIHDDVDDLLKPKRIDADDGTNGTDYDQVVGEVEQAHGLSDELVNYDSMMGLTFWSLLTSKRHLIRRGCYRVIATVFATKTYRDVVEKNVCDFNEKIFSLLNEKEVSNHASMWEALLVVSKECPLVWRNVRVEQVVLPRLWAQFTHAFHGSVEVSYPSVLPFLSFIPKDVVHKYDQSKGGFGLFYTKYLEQLWKGVDSSHVVGERVNTFMQVWTECLRAILTILSMDEELSCIDHLYDQLVKTITPMLQVMLLNERPMDREVIFWKQLVDNLALVRRFAEKNQSVGLVSFEKRFWISLGLLLDELADKSDLNLKKIFHRVEIILNSASSGDGFTPWLHEAFCAIFDKFSSRMGPLMMLGGPTNLAEGSAGVVMEYSLRICEAIAAAFNVSNSSLPLLQFSYRDSACEWLRSLLTMEIEKRGDFYESSLQSLLRLLCIGVFDSSVSVLERRALFHEMLQSLSNESTLANVRLHQMKVLVDCVVQKKLEREAEMDVLVTSHAQDIFHAHVVAILQGNGPLTDDELSFIRAVIEPRICDGVSWMSFISWHHVTKTFHLVLNKLQLCTQSSNVVDEQDDDVEVIENVKQQLRNLKVLEILGGWNVYAGMQRVVLVDPSTTEMILELKQLFVKMATSLLRISVCLDEEDLVAKQANFTWKNTICAMLAMWYDEALEDLYMPTMHAYVELLNEWAISHVIRASKWSIYCGEIFAIEDRLRKQQNFPSKHSITPALLVLKESWWTVEKSIRWLKQRVALLPHVHELLIWQSHALLSTGYIPWLLETKILSIHLVSLWFEMDILVTFSQSLFDVTSYENLLDSSAMYQVLYQHLHLRDLYDHVLAHPDRSVPTFLMEKYMNLLTPRNKNDRLDIADVDCEVMSSMVQNAFMLEYLSSDGSETIDETDHERMATCTIDSEAESVAVLQMFYTIVFNTVVMNTNVGDPQDKLVSQVHEHGNVTTFMDRLVPFAVQNVVRLNLESVLTSLCRQSQSVALRVLTYLHHLLSFHLDKDDMSTGYNIVWSMDCLLRSGAVPKDELRALFKSVSTSRLFTMGFQKDDVDKNQLINEVKCLRFSFLLSSQGCDATGSMLQKVLLRIAQNARGDVEKTEEQVTSKQKHLVDGVLPRLALLGETLDLWHLVMSETELQDKFYEVSRPMQEFLVQHLFDGYVFGLKICFQSSISSFIKISSSVKRLEYLLGVLRSESFVSQSYRQLPQLLIEQPFVSTVSTRIIHSCSELTLWIGLDSVASRQKCLLFSLFREKFHLADYLSENFIDEMCRELENRPNSTDVEAVEEKYVLDILPLGIQGGLKKTIRELNGGLQPRRSLTKERRGGVEEVAAAEEEEEEGRVSRMDDCKLTFLLLWNLLLDFFGKSETNPSENATKKDHGSPVWRSALVTYLNSTGFFKEYMSISYTCFLQSVTGSIQRLSLDELEKGHLDLLPHLANLHQKSFTHERNIVELGLYTFYRTVARLPTRTREWWNSECTRAQSTFLSSYLEESITPLLIKKEIDLVNQGTTELMVDTEEMTFKGSRVSREITATYVQDDCTIEMVIRIPKTYPLRVIEVDCTRRMGISEDRWRKWVLQIVKTTTSQDASLMDAIHLWKRNIDQEFEGVEPCPICYSILNPKTFGLPNLSCRTCSNKYHNSCLYKWFNQSGKNKCPVCQQPFS